MSIVLDVFIAAHLLAFALILYRLCRTPRRPSEAKRAAVASARTGLVPPAKDCQRGTCDALATECFDIYRQPAYGTHYEPERDAFVERLLDAIREQQEGEQA